MKAKESFNETHSVGHMLQKTSFKRVKEKPEDLDLRFFRSIFLSDTYDGRGPCGNGLQYSAVLYGNRIVWEGYKQHDNCSGGPEWEAGSYLYYKMHKVSEIYQELLTVGGRKYYREKPPKMSRERRGFCGIFFINAETFALLRSHPQFQELVHTFGLTLTPEGNTKRQQFRIHVSKFYKG